jgi:hypothetical protein
MKSNLLVSTGYMMLRTDLSMRLIIPFQHAMSSSNLHTRMVIKGFFPQQGSS